MAPTLAVIIEQGQQRPLTTLDDFENLFPRALLGLGNVFFFDLSLIL